MSGLIAIAYFLVKLSFNLLLFALLLRVALRYFQVSTLHPAGQLIYQLTSPIVHPIERLIYSGKTSLNRYDWVTLGLIVLIDLLKFLVLGLLFHSILLPLLYLILFTVADLVTLVCELLFFMILIRVIISWINPARQHPALDIINLITEPLLELGRFLIPNISGFDFSPIIIMIILKIIALFMAAILPFNM
ncbi:YggT family protein [Legionella clemsonensis]|uniref:YGGT family protein n=1 Tax=Legionella clemsonensis TaxID=1867846 RepID=A0A222P4T8_9GAMM|nr:YggT family protein [Legionella clemsonensis]ASQ46837.1 YGGT family protein [Legionella clemsonensis]